MFISGATLGLQLALDVKRRYTDRLLQHKNVLSLGVGFKEIDGQAIQEPSVVVGVSRKMPASQLAPEDMIPKTIDEVRTDVREVGLLRAQAVERARYRPATPGISCGHYRVTCGTLGCLVRRGSQVYILSNNHVLANTNLASQGDAILQPGQFDGGSAGEDTLAQLEEWIPLRTGNEAAESRWARATTRVLNWVAGLSGAGIRWQALRLRPSENRVDCAIARPLTPDLVSPEIMHIGAPRGVREGLLGMQVQKTGRTTGHTTGRITQMDVTAQVDYNGQKVTFVDQLMATGMSQGGDSGSAVLDMEGYVVGLLFAGSEVATLFTPIQLVLDTLRVELVTG